MEEKNGDQIPGKSVASPPVAAGTTWRQKLRKGTNKRIKDIFWRHLVVRRRRRRHRRHRRRRCCRSLCRLPLKSPKKFATCVGKSRFYIIFSGECLCDRKMFGEEATNNHRNRFCSIGKLAEVRSWRKLSLNKFRSFLGKNMLFKFKMITLNGLRFCLTVDCKNYVDAISRFKIKRSRILKTTFKALRNFTSRFVASNLN